MVKDFPMSAVGVSCAHTYTRTNPHRFTSTQMCVHIHENIDTHHTEIHKENNQSVNSLKTSYVRIEEMTVSKGAHSKGTYIVFSN